MGFSGIYHSLGDGIRTGNLCGEPRVLRLRLSANNIMVASTRMTRRVGSVFPLFCVRNESSEIVVSLHYSSFFVVRASVLCAGGEGSLGFGGSEACGFVFYFRQESEMVGLSPCITLVRLFVGVSVP